MSDADFAAAVRAVKEAASIAEVISDYVQLRRAGRNLVGLCPFPDHQERSPSFNVSPERRLFKCFGCNRAGDVFKFLQEMEGIGFIEAVERVAERFSTPFERGRGDAGRAEDARRRRLADLHAAAAAIFRTGLSAGEAGRRAADYLKRRGVSDAMAERFALGYSPVGDEALARGLKRAGFSPEETARAGLLAAGAPLSRFQGRIVFPILERTGRVVAFGGRLLDGAGPKYINSPESEIFDKSKILFGLNLATQKIRAASRAIVVEGYMDLIALHSAGFEETVAPLGTSLTARHIGSLVRLAERVLLFLDSDEAGLNAALRIGREFAGFDHEPYVVTLGAAAKDPDEFLKRYGPRLLAERIEKAPPYLDFVLSVLSRKVDLSTTAGRARAVRDFLEPVLRSGSPLKRGDYARRAADFLKIGVGELSEMVRPDTRAPRAAVPPRPAAPPPAERDLIQALLAAPAAFPTLQAALDAGEIARPAGPFAALLPALAALGASGDQVAFDLAVREHPWAAALAALRMEETADPARLFADALGHLRGERIARELADLEREIKALENSTDLDKMKSLQKRYLELVRRKNR